MSTPIIWTLVDAISAYALVETWRARSGAGKGKRDVLLAALYVSDLELARDKRQGTDEIAICQLLVQPVSVSPFAGVLYVIDIKHAAPVEYNVRCAWSVDPRRDPVLLAAHTT